MRTFEEAVEDVEGKKNVFNLSSARVLATTNGHILVFSGYSTVLFKKYDSKEEFIADVEHYDWRSLLL